MTLANDTTTCLDGLTVLIIEDEVLIGMMLANEIERAGAASVGPITSVADALREIESGVADVAIVDSKLADGSAADLAKALERRGMRYVVVSGYEKANLPKDLKDAPFVSKPISIPVLIETIQALTGPPVMVMTPDKGSAPGPSVPVDLVRTGSFPPSTVIAENRFHDHQTEAVTTARAESSCIRDRRTDQKTGH
jgi:CheY-like chemotaxis protein